MPRNFRQLVIFGAAIAPILFGVARTAVGDVSHRGPLAAGMSTGEVIEAWGEPAEKIEHETRRQMVWRYSVGKVVFSEGKLVTYPSLGSAPVDQKEVQVAAPSLPKRIVPPLPEEQGRDSGRDIIAEVLRDIPSEDDPPAVSKPGSGPPVAAPGVPRPVPARRPMLNDPEVDDL